MIGTALFLLFATAHANLDITDLNGFFENGCPEDASIKKKLPHKNCRQYYECHHGGLMPRLCPEGLNFNADLEKCDWRVGCHNKEIRIKKESEAMMNAGKGTDTEELDIENPSDALQICKAPNTNGVLVAHENCNEFYKCVYGRPVNLKCAKDLLYNTMNAKCDWPHNVDCGERVGAVRESHFSISMTNEDGAFPYTGEEIERSNSDPNQANALCAYRNSDGVLVAHESCDRFYKCFAGVPNTVKCPVNLFYNPIKEHCDWPRNVDCDGRLIPENEDNSNAEVEGKNSLKEKKEIFRDNRQSTKAADICADENSEGVLIAHQMCSHFYKCSGGEPVVFNCPGTLLYNLHKNYCDWPSNVVCGDRTLPADTGVRKSNKDNDTGDRRQAITICSAEGSDGILLTHERCNQFYECHDGQPVAITCPPHLLYNPETENCAWPTYVFCDDRKFP